MMEIRSEDDRKSTWQFEQKVPKKKNDTYTHTVSIYTVGGEGEKEGKEKRKIGIQFDGGTRMLLEEIRAGDNVTWKNEEENSNLSSTQSDTGNDFFSMWEWRKNNFRGSRV